jgi:nitroreductase
MEVFEAVRTVLAVRQYQEKSVPPEVVRRIVEAGRLTGSARNSQPWHFIVVQEKEMIQKLAALAPSGPYLAQAPLAIVVLVEQTRFAVSDASRAIQSMMLAGWAEGVGSNWVGFMSFEGVKALLHIPAEKDVLAILPFGYPVKGIGRGKKNRRELAEVASREVYGESFD